MKLHYTFLLACFWIIPLVYSGGQNLVPNASFEEYDICPGNYSLSKPEFRVNHWRSTNLGTPDNFNICSDGEANVPHNWAGVSEPYEGNGYVGIYLWMNNENNYREYLECTLLEPLIKDSLYEIEFHYKLSSYSRYSIDRIGLVVSDSLLTANHDKVIAVTPTVSIIQDSAFTMETGFWEIGRQKYQAKGGEQYVTIGNFYDNQSTHHYGIRFRPMQQPMLEKSAYYYIDNVSIIPVFKQIESLPYQEAIAFSDDHIEFEKSYILCNVQFEFDQYLLRASSFTELDKAVTWLKNNPDTNVTLSGHTDDQGSDSYNLSLSINRAKQVAFYFVTHGISPNRIETSGYGKTKPLVIGKTEEQRELNRRVEIMFRH